MEYSEFNVQMSRLMSCFAKGNISDELKSVYWEVVKRWDEDAFAYAITRSAQEDERFPKPNKLREYYSERTRGVMVADQSVQPTFLCRRCGDWFAVALSSLEKTTSVTCPCYGDSHVSKCGTRYDLQYLNKAWSERGDSLAVVLQ